MHTHTRTSQYISIVPDVTTMYCDMATAAAAAAIERADTIWKMRFVSTHTHTSRSIAGDAIKVTPNFSHFNCTWVCVSESLIRVLCVCVCVCDVPVHAQFFRTPRVRACSSVCSGWWSMRKSFVLVHVMISALLQSEKIGTVNHHVC